MASLDSSVSLLESLGSARLDVEFLVVREPCPTQDIHAHSLSALANPIHTCPSPTPISPPFTDETYQGLLLLPRVLS